MLYKISLESTLDVRLQFILPYILQLFKDENSRVKAKAVEVAVHMFKDIMDKANLTTLSATDYKVFDNYIMPEFRALNNDQHKDSYVHHVFVSCLPLLAQIGHRFLELSIGSRFARHYRHKGQHPQSAEEEKTGNDYRQSVEKIDALEDEEEDATSERLFQQSEYLVANNPAARSTIVIREGND